MILPPHQRRWQIPSCTSLALAPQMAIASYPVQVSLGGLISCLDWGLLFPPMIRCCDYCCSAHASYVLFSLARAHLGDVMLVLKNASRVAPPVGEHT
jgi:hypothetical protein